MVFGQPQKHKLKTCMLVVLIKYTDLMAEEIGVS